MKVDNIGFQYYSKPINNKNIKQNKNGFEPKMITEQTSGISLLKKGGLVSRSLSGGSNVTVYKSDMYSDDNPILKIVMVSENGDESESLLDPRAVDITNATDNEMLAVNAYLVEKGELDNTVYTSSAMHDINNFDVTLEDSTSVRKNFITNISVLREMQYSANNLIGYSQLSKILEKYNLFMQY